MRNLGLSILAILRFGLPGRRSGRSAGAVYAFCIAKHSPFERRHNG